MEAILGIGFLLFLNFVLSIVAGAVAGSKGRSVAGYFLLSLLFSFIVAILVLVAIPAKENQAIVRECPYCKEQIKREATICKHCGKEVEPLKPLSRRPFSFGENAPRKGVIPTVIACLLLLIWLSALGSPDLDAGWRMITLCIYLALLAFGIFRLVTNSPKQKDGNSSGVNGDSGEDLDYTNWLNK